MKKTTTILTLFVTALMFTACNNKESLQEYLVASQEKNRFITFDVPVNFFQPKSDEVSQDVKDVINSIHKINVVGLPYQNNEEDYEVEKTKIKEILNDSDTYKSLMSIKIQGYNVKLYYTGDSDAIDEVVAFGYAKDKGVGVARILGENMNPGQIMNFVSDIKVDGKGMNFGNFNF